MFLRVELIARSWSFFSRKRAQRPMDRKIFALRAPKEFGLRPPGSGDPFSNAHPRHAGGGSRHPVEWWWLSRAVVAPSPVIRNAAARAHGSGVALLTQSR